jgi:prolyl-tRNA synthetase
VAVNVRDEETKRASEHLYSKLSDDSIETLYDDRDERAGVKFKDSDLIGIPVRITVSEKTLRQGSVEIKKRSEKEMRLVKIEEAAGKVESLVSSQAG